MIRLVVDLGSWTTKINMFGCGVVLAEATCVAVSEEEGEVKIKAFGNTARALSGKAAKDTKIINPICEGDIVHPELMRTLFEYFLAKIEITPRKAAGTEVMFVVSCGASAELRQKYQDLAYGCGIGRVYFTRTPYAAVLGHNVTLTKTTPVFCLDMGCGKTDIAVFSADGIISGFTVNLGGGNVDVHIMDLMADNFGVRVGANTAEKLKNSVGSLLEDDCKTLIVGGRRLENGASAQAVVTSADLEDVIKLYVDKLCEYARAVLADLPAEVLSAVAEGGLYLSGGFSKLDGLAEYVSRKLDITVNISEEPSLASVIGGCSILSAPELCANLATLN